MEASLEKKILSYVAFAVAYGLSLFLVFTGCAVIFGQQLLGLLISSPPTHLPITLQLFSLSIPLLLVLSLNVLWYARSYGSMTSNSQRVVLAVIVGITLPLPFIADLLLLLPSAWIASYGIPIYLLALVLYSSISLLIFLTIITSLVAQKPKHFALSVLSQSKFWAAFLLSLFLLFLSLYPVVDAQTLEGLLPQTYDETIRRSFVSGLFALPVALVLPLFPWAFEYFGSRPSSH
jgi:hypothetical protein